MGQDNFDIKNDGSVFLVNTEVNANVRSEKSIYLQGVIVGDVHCNSKIVVDKHAVIRGNVYCLELETNGLINGDVQALCRAELGEHAIIKGYLQTACVQLCLNSEIERGLRLVSSKETGEVVNSKR